MEVIRREAGDRRERTKLKLLVQSLLDVDEHSQDAFAVRLLGVGSHVDLALRVS
jgi:hypothetical protein